MNLEHELRTLPIAFPDEPDLRATVLARLGRPRERSRWQPIAALAVVAALGALFAIPQTRAAILRVLEIGGVRIERTESQPQGERSTLVTGRRVRLDEARRAVQFTLAVPRRYQRIYLDRSIPGGMVSFVDDGRVRDLARLRAEPPSRRDEVDELALAGVAHAGLLRMNQKNPRGASVSRYGN